MPKAKIGDPETGRQISKAPARRQGQAPGTPGTDTPSTSEIVDTALTTPNVPDTGGLSDALPIPDLEAVGAPLLENVAQAQLDEAIADFENKKIDKAEFDRISASIEAGVDQTVQDADAQQARMLGTEADVMARLRGADEAIQAIPGKVSSEFEKLTQEFGTLGQEALGRLDSKEQTAIGEIQAGKNEALSAAVNGIQGNINQAIAQIQSDPNLTTAQKASMIARTRMSGAMAVAPVVGAHVLQFNTLTANTRANFAQAGAQVQNAILGGQAQLLGGRGAAFAQAQVAVGQMTNQLLETEANSAVNFANAQTQLLGARQMAINSGNQLMLQGLAEFRTPTLNLVDYHATLMAGTMRLIQDGAFNRATQLNLDIRGDMIKQMEGSFPMNLIRVRVDRSRISSRWSGS